MKIRKASLKDIKEMNRIYIEGSIDEGKLQFPNISKNKMIKELEKFEKERINGWKKEFGSRDNHWVVAEENKIICGFGNAEVKKNYSYKEGMVTMVYVDRNFRKKGIGEKILKEVILWLRKKRVRYIEAGLYWKNIPSKKLNEKLGFKPISLKMRLKIK